MNELDKIKQKKYAKLSKKERDRQNKYFAEWCLEMLSRKQKGNEKYGNWMMKINKKSALREVREELLDVCNHLIMLQYRMDELEQVK